MSRSLEVAAHWAMLIQLQKTITQTAEAIEDRRETFFADPDDIETIHHDSTGLEADAVIVLRGGRYALVEVKLGVGAVLHYLAALQHHDAAEGHHDGRAATQPVTRRTGRPG